jgi:hypothetical protein
MTQTLRSHPTSPLNRHMPHSETHATLATPGVEHSRSTMFLWIRDHTRVLTIALPNALHILNNSVRHFKHLTHIMI